MIYSDLKYINDQNGIQAVRKADGAAVYLKPGSDMHALALSGQFGSIAPYQPPAVFISAAMVKAEAARRILAICPVWKQRNLTAQASILAAKGRENWSDDDLAAWQGGEAVWSAISAVRAASDVIEALDPIPEDYTDDTHWP